MPLPKVFAFGQDLWDPSHRFETSWLFSPWVLFGLRALFALYCFVVQIFAAGYYCAHAELGGCWEAQAEFSYFTILTYWGLGFYFLVSAIHTFTYARYGTPLLDRFPRPLQALHSAYYTTVTVYPLIVTIVYWGVLYGGTWFLLEFEAWSNVSRHAMNSGFALFEIVFTRVAPPPMVHMLWLILVLALYLALAYLTRATKGFYVYSFLDPSWKGSGVTAGYILGIAVAAIVLYWVVWGLIFLRTFITEKKLGMDGKFAGQPKSSWRKRSAEADIEMSGLKETGTGTGSAR